MEYKQKELSKTSITLIKVKELENAVHPNNIMIGYHRKGYMVCVPEVGKSFVIHNRACDGGFGTSVVQKVITPYQFETLNSVYQIVPEVPPSITMLKREIRARLPLEFVKFLKKHGALSKFINNFASLPPCIESYHIYQYDIETRIKICDASYKDISQNLLDFGFKWTDSNEGRAYWVNIYRTL